MKLIFAVVHKEDAQKVTEGLNLKGFSVTKLCSTGGFLRSGNTTLLLGVEKERVDEAIAIIGNKSKARKHGIKVDAAGVTSIMAANAEEVVAGGATVFVTDVERFMKV